MAERQLPKLNTRVRFPSPAPSKNRMVKPLFSFPCGFLFVFFGEIGAKSPYFYLHASHMSVSRKYSASAVLQVFVELVNALSLVHRVQVRIYLERSRHVSVPHLRASLYHIYTGQITYYEHRPRPKKAVDRDSRYQRTARDLQHSGIGLGCSGCTRKQSHA